MDETLNEREFELINIIGARVGSNQRDLSRRMELSLGMVNLLLRRLISKGYIRINQLDKRKVEYLLTPTGISEKMRKSVRYTLKTIQSIGVIKSGIKDILSPVVKRGESKFVLLGESDFAVLVEMVLRELKPADLTITVCRDLPKETLEGILLICREEMELQAPEVSSKAINIIEELSKDYFSNKFTINPQGVL